MDFEQWLCANRSGVLWLSGPAECRISDASSRVVDLVKERTSQAQHLVLYFFCSTASAESSIAITFVGTIIYQLACCLPWLKGKIITVFLGTIFRSIRKRERLVSRFKPGDPTAVTVEKILNVSSCEYWSALRAVMDIVREQELSFIIDGLDKIQHKKDQFIRELCTFIEHIWERPPSTRVLLTSRPQAEIKGILGQLPSIEYDRERKGTIFFFFCSQEKQSS